jgi:hypothetical protein
MASVTEVVVGTSPTVILAKETSRGRPPVLLNAGANDIELTFGSDTDTFFLKPGKTIVAKVNHDVTGTVAAATEILQILEGMETIGF